MNKTLRIFPLLFSVLLAQKNLTGTISDESSGDPLIGANVIITNDDFNTGAATDQNGYFSINSVLPDCKTIVPISDFMFHKAILNFLPSKLFI